MFLNVIEYTYNNKSPKNKEEMKMAKDFVEFTMQVNNYVVHSPKAGSHFPFASAKMVVYLNEKRIEYFVDGKETNHEDFTEWLKAFNEMPEELTSIESWIA